MCWELIEVKEPGSVKDRRFFKYFTENNYEVQQIKMSYKKNYENMHTKLKKGKLKIIIQKV